MKTTITKPGLKEFMGDSWDNEYECPGYGRKQHDFTIVFRGTKGLLLGCPNCRCEFKDES